MRATDIRAVFARGVGLATLCLVALVGLAGSALAGGLGAQGVDARGKVADAAAAAAATATTAPAAATAVDLQVTYVLASKGGEPGVAPELSGLAKYLKKSFKGFGRFEHLGAGREKVVTGATATFGLPDGSTLTLTPSGGEGGRLKLGLTHGTLKTTVSVKDGGLFFQAGEAHKGGVLVLAIRATSLKPTP